MRWIFVKILIVGYGSMGRRRIRLLERYSNSFSFLCVDTNSDRIKQIKEDNYVAYSNLTEAIDEKPDVAFVCTSPGNHANIILQLIKAGIDVFTELNLISDGYDEILYYAKTHNVKVFMSNTMLYDRQILAMMDIVGKKCENNTYIYHVGQYLPDWHPWENYKDFFIGRKETNGCREIMAIQLPWMIEMFGKINNYSVIKNKNTRLDIDFDDTFIISFEHERGNIGVFVCDVVARKAVSYLEIMGENIHIIWNGTPESLLVYDVNTKQMCLLPSYEKTEHIDGYADIINEDQYYDEINAFLKWVKGEAEPSYYLEDDKYVLELIDEIEGIQR